MTRKMLCIFRVSGKTHRFARVKEEMRNAYPSL